MSTPAAPGYKPTTEQMLKLWLNRHPLSGPIERIESEVGFFEWLEEIRNSRTPLVPTWAEEES